VVQQDNAYKPSTKAVDGKYETEVLIIQTKKTKGLYFPSKALIILGYQNMIYYTPELLRKKSHDHRLQRQYNLLKAVLEFTPI